MERKRLDAKRMTLMSIAALALVATGAMGATAVLRGHADRTEAVEPITDTRPASGAEQAEHGGHSGGPGLSALADGAAAPAGQETELLVTPEAVAQADIKTVRVGTAEAASVLEVPGVVSANAYREVRVTPLVGGVVRQVHAELGMTVKRGAPLVTLFSNDLAEAQMRLLSMRAMGQADRQRLERTRELAEIGAASRQEIEEATAAYTSRATEIEAARQKLLLFGLTPAQVNALRSPEQIVSEIVVRAPIAGVVTGRSANLGVVVEPRQELLVVTDLSDVWVVGDVYEQDFRAVEVGATAVLTTAAYPDLVLKGRVSYIDPRVEQATRTAKVRVAVSNGDGRLRLGMYMNVAFRAKSGSGALTVPRGAVQTIGTRQVVYLPVDGEEGRYVERTITTGPLVGDAYTVLEGLRPGETVVSEGSFYLRAESVRNAPS